MPYKNKAMQRAAVRKAMRRYRARHPDRVKASKAKYYSSHRAEINARRRLRRG